MSDLSGVSEDRESVPFSARNIGLQKVCASTSYFCAHTKLLIAPQIEIVEWKITLLWLL